MRKITNFKKLVVSMALSASLMLGSIATTFVITTKTVSAAIDPAQIPWYTGSPYTILNDNVPEFTESDMTTEAFETYSEHDSLGRCGVAYANICKELMPTEKRGTIGHVKPSGWHTVKYMDAGIDGNYLYNRCHCMI